MESLSKYVAFRFRGGELEPVKNPSIPDPDDLLGIDRQKEILFRNTRQFVLGYPANDVLLWGDRGTGKSSLVKSLLKVFKDEGLKIVQIYKWEIPSLSDLYSVLRSSPYRFILFFDDLSFEPSEEAFKLLKSLLDGDIEERPENTLVYVTSNRRNIIAQREYEDKFPQDSYQEAISLAERFGIRLSFHSFNKEMYLKIVKHYIKKRKLDIDEKFVEEEALRWATERGSFSGRVAFQFVKDLEGRYRLGLLL